LAYLYIPGKGGSNFIIAEPSLQIFCPNERFHSGMLEFPQSVENKFAISMLERQAYLSDQQNWLQEKEYFSEKEKDSLSNAFFSKLLGKNKKEIQQFKDTLKRSKYYAARYIELMQFMQRLYNTTQTFNKEEQQLLTAEMENTLDIRALYHAGDLWTDIHTYYPGLFIRADRDSMQEEAYARSIITTMQRLDESLLMVFLSAALTVCERFDYPKAQEMMLTDFITRYPTLPLSDIRLQKMVEALGLIKGSKAPAIAGLSQPVSQPTILIFFDSTCDHCRHEIDWLMEHYEEITAKGYRIVSIAADTYPDDYQSFSAVFPWDKADQLCDFKGFEGENFRNYCIVGTPMIFIIDNKGIIVGKYVQTADYFK
jgi:peroxiredoxin